MEAAQLDECSYINMDITMYETKFALDLAVWRDWVRGEFVSDHDIAERPIGCQVGSSEQR
jgi:hypothetical protein